MEIINTTAVVAQPGLAGADDIRRSFVTAKATFDMDSGELETQNPAPMFANDEPTEFGLLPSDAHARFDDAFEVIVLGRAYAGRKPVRSRVVSLSVGEETRHLAVSGDRVWTGSERRSQPSEAALFETMPLTYEHAFGGKCDVFLDARSPLEVQHPLNSLGRGFDPQPMAAGLQRQLRLPDGLPFVRYQRALPNIEGMQERVAVPTDDPVPAGWATVPREIGLSTLRAVQGKVSANLAALHRAHPDWMIDRPASGSTVRMTGLQASGGTAFALPRLRVFADIEDGTHELCPQVLVLLPEQRRFYIIYRTLLEGAVPRARLRVDTGNCPEELTPRGLPS